MAELFEPQQTGIVISDKRSAALTETLSPYMTPMQELQMQIVRTGDLEKLKELRQIEKEWRADQAKQAFVNAMAAFKAEPAVIQIVKDKKNKQYSDSPYASLGKEASVVVPLLAKHGMSADWGINQTDKGITISCTVTHREGHSKDPVSITLPPDASGSKNLAQQIKSSITYGRIITLECACGIAPIDSLASLNDDGNSAGGSMDDCERKEWLDKIGLADSEAELKMVYLSAQKEANDAKDKGALATFADAKNKRYKELKGAKA